MTPPDSDAPVPAPAPDNARAYWYPRVRGGLTVIGGTLAYVAIASAFGNDASFVTAFVGMIGSLVMMLWVWWLEARRDAKPRGGHHPRDKRQ